MSDIDEDLEVIPVAVPEEKPERDEKFVLAPETDDADDEEAFDQYALRATLRGRGRQRVLKKVMKTDPRRMEEVEQLIKGYNPETFIQRQGYDLRSRKKEAESADRRYEAAVRAVEDLQRVIRLKDEKIEKMEEKEKSQRHQVKMYPLRYNGETDLEAYLEQFELISGIRNWTKEDKAGILASRLEGKALKAAHVNQNKTYDAIVVKLRRRFSTDLKVVWRDKLAKRCQKAGEGLDELHEDVMVLVNKAYPSTDATTTREMAQECFVRAIEDAELRGRVYDLMPDTYSKTLALALRLQSRTVIDRKATGDSASIKSPSEPPVVTESQKQPSEKVDRVQALSEQVMELQSTVNKQQEKLNAPRYNRPRDNRPRDDRPKRTQSGRDDRQGPRKTVTCYNCHFEGHIRRWCPFEDSTKTSNSQKKGLVPLPSASVTSPAPQEN